MPRAEEPVPPSPPHGPEGVPRREFDAAYKGTPPWDTGRPQEAIIELTRSQELGPTVLDVGCGTGENAMYLALKGHEVLGVDSAPRAIRKARKKARERNVKGVHFKIHNALRLGNLGPRRFDTAVDSGLFHVFSDEDRATYVKELHRVLRPQGRAVVLCFSDKEPPGWGPRRVSEPELRQAFSDGWAIASLEETRFETNLSPKGASAWRLVAIRT